MVLIRKILTHWTVAFLTLALLVFLRVQDNGLVETARLKSFDYLQSTDPITVSEDIVIVEVDEASNWITFPAEKKVLQGARQILGL